jgi:hypothetical protein
MVSSLRAWKQHPGVRQTKAAGRLQGPASLASGKKTHSTALALRDISCMSKQAELSNRKARIHVKSAEDAEDAKGLERPLTRLTSFLLMCNENAVPRHAGQPLASIR